MLRWSQLRPTYPDREVHLFGAGVHSGTFDYFTDVITGAPRDSRGDYTSSEDDNTLVQGVAGDPNALGYFGFAYYEANHEYVRAVAIRADASADAVLPTRDTIRSGAYRPLARPVFVYVNVRSLDRDDVRRFVDYYTTHVTEVANDVGYVPLEARVQDAVRARLEARRTGSLFAGDVAHPGPDPGSQAGRGVTVAIVGRRVVEAVIERALWACAALSVVVTVGIVGVLAWEAAAFFREVSPGRVPDRANLDAVVPHPVVRRAAASSPARCWSWRSRCSSRSRPDSSARCT